MFYVPRGIMERFPDAFLASFRLSEADLNTSKEKTCLTMSTFFGDYHVPESPGICINSVRLI